MIEVDIYVLRVMEFYWWYAHLCRQRRNYSYVQVFQRTLPMFTFLRLILLMADKCKHSSLEVKPVSVWLVLSFWKWRVAFVFRKCWISKFSAWKFFFLFFLTCFCGELQNALWEKCLCCRWSCGHYRTLFQVHDIFYTW